MARKQFFFKIGIIIPFLLISLMSQNIYAATQANITTVLYAVVNRSLNGAAFSNASTIQTATNTPATVATMGNFQSYFAKTLSVSANLPQSAAGASITFHLSGRLGYNGASYNAFTPNLRGGLSGYVRPEQGTITNYNDSYNFYGTDINGGSDINSLEFIIDSTVSLQSSTEIRSFVFTLNNPDNYIISCSNTSGSMVKPCVNGDYYYVSDLRLTYDIALDPTYAQNQTIINQNNTQINQNQQIIDHNNKEEESADNIENQSPSDINNASNSATTNLIGILSNFVGQLSSFSATNCNVTIPFPVFLGGNKVVNICQNKDKAGDLISIIGSLILIGFYIPLAIVLLKMIYGEIRSFTNG